MSARRLALALAVAAALGLGISTTALAHPLGNYTVNRAVAVTVRPAAVSIHYVIDMAEIPAFAALQAMDTNADGATDASERAAWAGATCAAAVRALVVTVEDQPLALAPVAGPKLSFPPGAGGLETVRLQCDLRAPVSPATGRRALSVVDRTDDGHVGWREVTIAGDGVVLVGSDVPATSPSAQLTAYPTGSLDLPPDVRSGSAGFHAGGIAGPAVARPIASQARATAADPLAALIEGEMTVPVMLLALLIAAGLGAAHALSPGHGKTLVAAYVIGSRGTLRQAAGLGATVAVTHTLGVFVLGGLALAAGELFVPERVIAWLSVASGGLVAVLGLALLWRAVRPRRTGPAHPHEHTHRAEPFLSRRGLVALGLAGGMVPSASALIVLLAAVSTGRLLFGMSLILAFGLGMATVLAGLAAATTMARRTLTAPGRIGSSPLVRRAAGLLPIASGALVLAIGAAVTLAALGRVG
jgi:nickel/cobalt transporter (NicO) family protein